ncbi:MAG: GNAT family N-acetyltransferase [Candidatus Eremiobacteraeota bacterium]|nr:GNAT family N-acetyltransferase [Candidatus Eremiobacteraeota bacterium]
MIRTEPLSGALETAALAYLSRAPYDHVFLTYLILFDVASATRNAIRIAVDETGAVTGAGYFGRQVVLAADDDETIEALAVTGRAFRGERMIVGPRETIARYWNFIRDGHTLPRLVRDRQYVMMLDRAMLRPYEHAVVARRARIDEWTAVADNSALMIGQELDYDPRRSSPEFTSNVRAMIERGLWWVGESYGRLCFFCNIGPWSPQTAQLQGIWTPEDLRGKGLATEALSAVCDRLLTMSPTLSLYVNDFNTKAIALYDRVGFKTVSEFQTLLF